MRGAREKGDVISLLVLDPEEVLLSTVLAREMVPGLMSTMVRKIAEGVESFQLSIPSGSPHEFIGNAGERWECREVKTGAQRTVIRHMGR